MGINLKQESWTPIITKWREAQKCKGESYACCKKHTWNLYGEHMSESMKSALYIAQSTGQILCSDQMKKWLDSVQPIRDENGKELPRTPRGKRRAAARKEGLGPMGKQATFGKR